MGEITKQEQEVETLLIQLVRAFGRGYRDDSLSEELTGVEQGPLAGRAIRWDGGQQWSFEHITGGAVQSRRGGPDYFRLETAADPS